MKMDAKQKRRMWKVVFGHFCLTILFILIVTSQPAIAFSGNVERWLKFQEHLVWDQAWSQFWTDVAFLLQPPFWLSAKILRMGIHSVFLTWLILISSFVLIPIWSICFGWLFVKLDNWLNHFPVLGKKVF
jgi:hypothetical protein